MSSEQDISIVEFERREAHLSGLEEDPPYTVHGVAIGEGDITRGSSGIKKKWPGEELQKGAESLQGSNLVVDHDNTSSGVVGLVTKAGYKDGVGVLYEAELYDKDLAEKIDNGLLEVSIRGYHIDTAEMEESDDGAKVVEEIKFENLSIVPSGAAPSNTIDMGESTELSVSELAEATADFESVDRSFDEELQEISPADWVKWDDYRGIVLLVQDGTAEVDVYEKKDDTWRPVGETKEVDPSDLEQWDVDEDDVGAAQDDEEDEEEDDSDEEENENMTDEEEEELQEYSFHEVSWDGTTESDWSNPSMEDFDTDDLSVIADHFLISMDGFPPENYGDLKLPVVEPSGELNVNALQAVKGGRGVSAVDGLSSEKEEKIVNYVNQLANDEFDRDWGESDEEMANDGSVENSDTDNDDTTGGITSPVTVLTGDDLRSNGESEQDGDQIRVINMNDELEDRIEELEDPTVMETADLEELREKASQYDEISEDIASLRERTEILDEVDRSSVEQLNELEEPKVIETERYEELEESVEQVKTLLAENLAEEVGVFDAEELTDRFDINELREKHEEHIGALEDELSVDPAPKSEDHDEEELEDDPEEEQEAEELETIENEQNRLQSMILD